MLALVFPERASRAHLTASRRHRHGALPFLCHYRGGHDHHLRQHPASRARPLRLQEDRQHRGARHQLYGHYQGGPGGDHPNDVSVVYSSAPGDQARVISYFRIRGTVRDRVLHKFDPHERPLTTTTEAGDTKRTRRTRLKDGLDKSGGYATPFSVFPFWIEATSPAGGRKKTEKEEVVAFVGVEGTEKAGIEQTTARETTLPSEKNFSAVSSRQSTASTDTPLMPSTTTTATSGTTMVPTTLTTMTTPPTETSLTKTVATELWNTTSSSPDFSKSEDNSSLTTTPITPPSTSSSASSFPSKHETPIDGATSDEPGSLLTTASTAITLGNVLAQEELTTSGNPKEGKALVDGGDVEGDAGGVDEQELEKTLEEQLFSLLDKLAQSYNSSDGSVT